jgi:hypothetical protein
MFRNGYHIRNGDLCPVTATLICDAVDTEEVHVPRAAGKRWRLRRAQRNAMHGPPRGCTRVSGAPRCILECAQDVAGLLVKNDSVLRRLDSVREERRLSPGGHAAARNTQQGGSCLHGQQAKREYRVNRSGSRLASCSSTARVRESPLLPHSIPPCHTAPRPEVTVQAAPSLTTLRSSMYH